MYKILLVEDDRAIAQAICRHITAWGLQIQAASNFRDIMAEFAAYDFIAKPFDLTVLTAKIQAALRRAYNFTGQTAVLEHRGALLNIANASLSYQEQKLSLSKNDLRILQVLLENQGNVVSRETLMQRLWETNSFIDENTLSVNVARLRKKLDALGLTDFIITKKGLGYLVP